MLMVAHGGSLSRTRWVCHAPRGSATRSRARLQLPRMIAGGGSRARAVPGNESARAGVRCPECQAARAEARCARPATMMALTPAKHSRSGAGPADTPRTGAWVSTLAGHHDGPGVGPEEYGGHDKEEGQLAFAGRRAQGVVHLTPAVSTPEYVKHCGGQRLRPPQGAAQNRPPRPPRNKRWAQQHASPRMPTAAMRARITRALLRRALHARREALARRRRPAPSPARRICRAPATGPMLASRPISLGASRKREGAARGTQRRKAAMAAAVCRPESPGPDRRGKP